MLLDNEQAREFIPKGLLKKNKHDAYINGIWMVVVLSGAIIVIQSLGDSAAGILTAADRSQRRMHAAALSVGICRLHRAA